MDAKATARSVDFDQFGLPTAEAPARHTIAFLLRGAASSLPGMQTSEVLLWRGMVSPSKRGVYILTSLEIPLVKHEAGVFHEGVVVWA